MRKKYSLQNHRRIKHSMQAFADRAADDFGITQREVLERPGLRINAENAPRTFDDGSRINENGEFVDAKIKWHDHRVQYCIRWATQHCGRSLAGCRGTWIYQNRECRYYGCRRRNENSS